MRAILLAVRSHKSPPRIETVAVPGLCTGVGGMDVEIAAMPMWGAYEQVVLGRSEYPADFGDAQKAQLRMNPRGRIYD